MKKLIILFAFLPLFSWGQSFIEFNNNDSYFIDLNGVDAFVSTISPVDTNDTIYMYNENTIYNENTPYKSSPLSFVTDKIKFDKYFKNEEILTV